MSKFELEDKRPSWDEYFMDMARAAARRSNCARRKVGAVLVLHKRLIASGYCGSPAGLEHCPTTDPEGHPSCMEYGHCVRTVHAEVNAITACAQGGQSTFSATLYTTTFPCRNCMGIIINAGIKQIIYADHYTDPSHQVDVQSISKKMAEDAGIKVVNLRELEPGWVGVRA